MFSKLLFLTFRTPENLKEFLSNCDYVVNVLPSTEQTRNLLSGNMLQNCSTKVFLECV